MAAVSKSKVAQSLRNRLNALGCPYTEGVDDSWIMELVFLRGEPRIRLLQWLLSKYDIRLGEMVENTQPGSVGVSRMDSRIQRLLFVVSSLGLCRYNDVDLIRGVETLTTSSLTKQVAFIDQLLDIVMIHDAAEDPLTKSMLTPGIVSDSTPLEEQLRADRRYMDNLASLQLPSTMLTPTVDLVPHDIRRLMMQQQSSKDSPKSPSLQKLTEMSHAVEKSLSRRMEVLQDLQETEGDLPETLAPGLVQRASQSLSLVLSELSQLVLNFTYCFENEMLPWCDKSPPSFSQLGPSFKRVHTLTLQFSQMLQGLHQIHQSYKQLSKGVSHKLKVTDDSHSALLAEVSQAAASSFQECVDILEQSLQHGHPTLITSLCSTTLKL